MTPNAFESFSRDKLQVLLAETLGWEKSREVIDRALAELGIRSSPTLMQSDVNQLLDRLCDAHGLPGVAARFARRRLESGGAAPAQGSAIEAGTSDDDCVTAQPRRTLVEDVVRFQVDDLVELLSPSIDPATGRDVVERTARALGLASGAWSRAEGMAIMEQLSKEPGLVGVVSQLGKARLRLTQPKDRARTQ